MAWVYLVLLLNKLKISSTLKVGLAKCHVKVSKIGVAPRNFIQMITRDRLTFLLKQLLNISLFKYAILEVEKSLGFAQFSIAILGHFQAKSWHQYKSTLGPFHNGYYMHVLFSKNFVK